MLLEINDIALCGYAEHPRLCNKLLKFSDLLNCKFTTGLNFIFCNLQDLGWGISHAICDGKIIADYSKSVIEIIFREDHLSVKELNNASYYVGAEIDKNKYLAPSFDKRLRDASKNSKYSVTELKKAFMLEERNCSKPIGYMWAPLYEYSVALGMALNKKIFCYPWMYKKWGVHEYNWKLLSTMAEKHNLIFIIPVDPDVDLKNADFDYKIVEFEKSDKNEA